MPRYLYEYHFKDSRWSFDIHADDRDEARERLKLLGNAKYVGEVQAVIPASMGWLAKGWCVVANFFRSAT